MKAICRCFFLFLKRQAFIIDCLYDTHLKLMPYINAAYVKVHDMTDALGYVLGLK